MIRLKQLIFTICALSAMTLVAFGQQNNQRNFDRIESQKVAYITKQLNLTTSEAQRFFPLYNQYNKEIRAIRAAKSDVIAPSNARSVTAQRGGDVIEFDAKEVELKKQYRAKFSEVVGAARASQFFVVEQEFRDMLYKEWQSRNRKE